MVLVLVRLHLVPFRVVALHRRGAVAGGMQVAWGGGLCELGSAAAVSRVPVRRKALKAPHRGAIGSTVLASQRLETSIRSYAVVHDSANPSRRALYSIVEQAGNPVKVRESPRFTMF